MSQTPASAQPQGEPRWFVVLVFALMLVGLQLAAGPKVRLSEWRVRQQSNHGLMEAKAWRAGRLDLPIDAKRPEIGAQRPRDTAYHQGKVYNVFPPLFTFLAYAALALQDLQGLGGAAAEEFYAPWYVAVVAGPLLLLGFWAFRAATG